MGSSSPAGFAIQGSPVNWAWSFRDLLRDELSPSARDGSMPPEDVGKNKSKLSILWAFRREEDFKELEEAAKAGAVRVALVSMKLERYVSKSIIAVGRVLPGDVLGRKPWDYWPEGENWDYKFFIRIDRVAPAILETLPVLEGLEPGDFREGGRVWSDVLSRWAASVVALVPSYIVRGSLFPLPEQVVRQIGILARAVLREVAPRLVWDPARVMDVLRRWKVLVPEEAVEEAVRALASGKHLLLWGVPGTGKTTLARAIAEAHGLDLVVRTATAEWSRVDLVGGPVFVGGRVVWRCGALLEAIARHCKGVEEGTCSGAMLLIDEINRANLDRAFGEFFTVFGSSDPGDWYVPESVMYELEEYEAKGAVDRWGEYLLDLWRSQGRGPLKVPEGFRVVGTMNTYDRRYLFTLGYALLRRFAVVELRNPSDDRLEEVLGRYCDDEGVVKETMGLYRGLREEAELELGVSLLIDTVKLACGFAEREGPKKAVDRALRTTVIAQFEGLPSSRLKKVAEVLEGGGYESSFDTFKRLYSEALGQ